MAIDDADMDIGEIIVKSDEICYLEISDTTVDSMNESNPQLLLSNIFFLILTRKFPTYHDELFYVPKVLPTEI